jgi:hypothetical protein
VISTEPCRVATLLDHSCLKGLISHKSLERWHYHLNKTARRLVLILWVFESHCAFNIDAQNESLVAIVRRHIGDRLSQDCLLVLSFNRLDQLSYQNHEVKAALETVGKDVDVKALSLGLAGCDKVINNLNLDPKLLLKH